MSVYTSGSTGIYSVKWVNRDYLSPIFTIRRSTDSVVSDFYVSSDGSQIGTQSGGTGTPLKTWLNGATAYITKLWDQSTKGKHATQTTPANQPVFNTTKNCMVFTASSSQYFNLPDNTVPSGNSNYTVIVKHGIVTNLGNTGPNSGGLLGSGTTNANQLNSFSIGTSPSANYTNYWWSPDFGNQGTYLANSTVSWKYNGANRYFYMNGASMSSAASSSRASTTLNNFIGRGDTFNNNYLDGELYFVFVYNSALDDATRILVENPIVPYQYNINNSNLLYYYPFDTNYLDYNNGEGVSDIITTTNVSISTPNTKLTSGSLAFPGSSTQIVKVPNTTFLTNGITFSVWVKIASILPDVPGYYTRIFDFGNSNSTGNYVIMYFNGEGVQLSLLGNSIGGASYNSSFNFGLPDFNWHHYCITISSTGKLTLYLDGIDQNVSATVYPSTSAVFNSNLIGISNYPSNNTDPYVPLNAYMNQFLVFNRAITPLEISYLVTSPSQISFNGGPTTPPYPCFLEGSKILRLDPDSYQESYVPVETLRKGDIIVTACSGYKPIHSIGYKTIRNPKTDLNPSNRLYGFTSNNCPNVFKPLYITGDHCTLHLSIPDEKRDKITQHMGDVYITEDYYRMPAFLDDRAEPFDGPDTPATIWHFALEHENLSHNYGVYANGLLVETCAIKSLREKSGMKLVD